VSLAALSFGGIAWGRALAREHAQVQRLTRITASATTIREIEDNLPTWTRLPKSAALAPEVTATLAAAGLPASAMASLSAEPDTGSLAGPGGGQVQVRARRATLVLASITLPQLGDALGRWRARQPGWTIASIDLAPEAGAIAAKAQTGGDLPLRAVVSLETLSLERPTSTSAAPEAASTLKATPRPTTGSGPAPASARPASDLSPPTPPTTPPPTKGRSRGAR
jgi:hypothetical protein